MKNADSLFGGVQVGQPKSPYTDIQEEYDDAESKRQSNYYSTFQVANDDGNVYEKPSKGQTDDKHVYEKPNIEGEMDDQTYDELKVEVEDPYDTISSGKFGKELNVVGTDKDENMDRLY